MNKTTCLLLLILSYFFITTNSHAQANLKELKSQLKSVESALEADPSNLELMWNHAGINFELGRVTNKIKYYRIARDQYNALYELMPDNLRVHLLAYSSNYTLVWLGDTADTTTLENLFNKFDRESKKSLTPPSTAKLLARINNPKLYGDNLKSDEEVEKEYIKNLRDGIKEQPDFSANYQMLSTLYSGQRKYSLAIAIAKQGLNKSPEDPTIFNKIGELYMELIRSDFCAYNNEKEIKEAETHFLKAIKIEPKAALYRSNISEVYEYQRRHFLTLNEAKKAYELDPKLETLERLILVETIYGSKDKANSLIKTMSKRHGSAEAKYSKASLAMYQHNFSKAYKFSNVDQYSYVYSYLSKGIYGDQAKKKRGSLYYAEKALENNYIVDRERNLAEYLANKISYEKLVESNATSCDELEAHFYYGYKSMLNGDFSTAKTQFEKTLDFDFQSYTEHDLAKFFLQKISAEN